MKTRILAAVDPHESQEAIQEAAKALRDGSLIIFPTETVYGLGASAASPDALEAMNRLKERRSDKPFTLHLADPQEAERYAGRLSTLARCLVRKCWPGPVTLVVPDRREPGQGPAGLVEKSVYWERTVGLRCPSHAIGRAILRHAGVPAVATSANRAGRPPPHQASDALAELDGKVPLVVDAGPTAYRRPSTVVRIHEDDSYEVLREGAVTAHRIARLARMRVVFVCTGNMCRSPMAEGFSKQMAAERLGCDPAELEERGIEFSSLGTAAAGSGSASRNAIETMAERGIDIRDHRRQPITVDSLRTADYIWVMTRDHLETVVRLAPEVAERVSLLDLKEEDVSDPIGGDLEAYRACAGHIESALANRIGKILA